ncbi:serine/arginine repetitive matrix protein 1-like [Lineus longissimus]|uniref:serine/arginine repetitive matrix protein 1-like n=1 Tax=Lineus longissimus TaxID=88925 RepID=UPI00315D70AA
MAAVLHRSGQISPTNFGRPLERVFEDAQSTGEINLIGRKLKDFPKVANKYDLSDTAVADLSKNRLNEVPIEICECPSIERLVCYHNVIRCLPEALVQLQCLTYMNLSRNQLSTIPPFICHIQSLEILIVSNNKLVSLPEEIGQLQKLTELDVSCNEITHLPMQIGNLESLRVFNVRKNLLVELPPEIGKLKLRKLDFSSNRIAVIPPDFRKIDTLDSLSLDHNPLTSPPSYVCLKGRVHIMKYLQLEAMKEDRKRGILSDNDMRRNFRKSSSIHVTSDDFSRFTAESPMRLRNADSGYNTTDSTEKVRWSPSEVNNTLDEYTAYVPKPETVYERLTEVDETRSEDLPPPPPELMPPSKGRYQPTFTPPTPRTPSTPHRDNHYQNGQSSQPGPSPQNAWQTEVMDEFSRVSSAWKQDWYQQGALCQQMGLNQSASNINSMAGPTSGRHADYNGVAGISPGGPGPGPGPGGGQRQMSRPVPAQKPTVQPAQKPPAKPGADDFTRVSGAWHDTTSFHSSPHLHAVPCNEQDSPVGGAGERSDQFSQELQRQKADYEAKKKRAEALRRQQEDDEEREQRRRAAIRSQEEEEEREQRRRAAVRLQEEDEERDQRRRAAVRLQEEQQKLMERQRESPRKQLEDNRKPLPRPRRLTVNNCYSYTPPPNGNPNNNYGVVDGYSESQEHKRRPVTQSSSFRDRTSPLIAPNKISYRRATSDTKFENSASIDRSTDDSRSWNRNIQDSSSSHSPSPGVNRTTNHNVQPEEEFRHRHETMRNIHQQEGQNVRKRLEEEKDRLFRLHKEPLYSYLNKKTGSEEETTPSRDPMSTSNSSTNSSLSNKPRTAFNIKLPEELRYANPNFTVRRHLEQAREEMSQIENLRRDIESRLKVKLPEDLPCAIKDGVVLCHLANHIRPRSVSSIHVPSPAVPTLSMAKCRRNVENFLDACRRIGLDEAYLCACDDVLEELRPALVAKTVQQLLSFPRITTQDKLVSLLCVFIFVTTVTTLLIFPLPG